jgi:hypothetical protein
MKDQNNQSPKFQGRHGFRQHLRYELKRLPFLLLYLLSVFEWIVIQRPMIHLLVVPVLMASVAIAIRNMLEYLLRIWTHGPSEAPVTFHWWEGGEDLLTFVGPYVLLALLMWLNHSTW